MRHERSASDSCCAHLDVAGRMFAIGVTNAAEGEAKARATIAVFIEKSLEVDEIEKSCCDSLSRATGE